MFVYSYRPHTTLTVFWPTIMSPFSSTVLGMLVGSCKYKDVALVMGLSLF